MSISRLGKTYFEGAQINVTDKISLRNKINELVDESVTPTADSVTPASGTYTIDGDEVVTGDTTMNGSLTVAGVYSSFPNTYSSATSITAFATGGQASATQLTNEFNEITTCATAGDSVKLPTAGAGGFVVVKNNGATAADIFPATGDSINTLAANTAIRIAPGSTKMFRAVDATVWEENTEISAVTDGSVGTPAYTFNTQPNMGFYKVSSTQLGVSIGGALKGGFDSNGLYTGTISEQVVGAGIAFANVKISKTLNSITAHAGGGQGSATALSGEYNIITTVGTAGDSCVLPTPALGMRIVVVNTGTKAADIFPATGHTINELSANTQVSLGPQQLLEFTATSTTAWKTTLGATATVSQATNITTGVTLNARKGVVTTQSATTAANAADTFTVTNSAAVATSTIRAWVMDYSGTFATNGLPCIAVDNITTGAFDIVLMNAHAANALSGTLKIGFEIIN